MHLKEDILVSHSVDPVERMKLARHSIADSLIKQLINSDELILQIEEVDGATRYYVEFAAFNGTKAKELMRMLKKK